MAQCRFKTDTRYLDEKTGEYIPYKCLEPKENIWENDLCIFHDENYLADLENKEANEQDLKRKLSKKLAEPEPLICIGYHLPDLSFANRRFDKPVNFSGARFTGRANFSGARFTGRASFANARFTEANFANARFTEANFANAGFTEFVDFFGTQFTNKADFTYTKMAKARFGETRFSEAAYFTGAQFTIASFYDARFAKEAYFSEVYFTESVDFFAAQFAKEANFSGVRFAKEADFSEAQFREIAYFRNVQFDDQEHTHFLTDDLSRVSFVETDISRIRFGENVEWGLANRPTEHFLKKRWYRDGNQFKILDEREIDTLLASRVGGLSIESLGKLYDIRRGRVVAIYRNLRENYEYRMRYDEAGEFFIREMEMKRKYKDVRLKKTVRQYKEEDQELEDKIIAENKHPGQTIIETVHEIQRNNWIIRNFSLTGLYYHLSRYGQSFSRPTIFGIGIILFSTLLWLTQSNPAGDFSVYNITMPVVNNATNLEVAFERSLTNFLPSLSFGTPLNVGLLDVAFKIVGGAVTFGLIIIALRRKFERKFRH